MKLPVRGQTYTLTEIETELKLRDSPFLRVNILNGWYAVQDSHLEIPLVEIPGWADSKWMYQRETEEWIPLFAFQGTQEEQEALINFEAVPEENKLSCDDEFFVYPKGFPCTYRYR